MNSAERCRKNGWVPGTRIVGDEGYGPTVIEITAVGETGILAKTIRHDHQPNECPSATECSWTLSWRDWKKIDA